MVNWLSSSWSQFVNPFPLVAYESVNFDATIWTFYENSEKTNAVTVS